MLIAVGTVGAVAGAAVLPGGAKIRYPGDGHMKFDLVVWNYDASHNPVGSSGVLPYDRDFPQGVLSGADEIQQLLLDAEPGARGIVYGSRGPDPGHVFKAVNQRGVVRFLDGQSGGPASFQGFDGFHFLRTNP